MEERINNDTFTVNLILTAGVIVTVLLALLLSQLDTLQRRTQPSPPPIAGVTLVPATATPLPVIPLPTSTATDTPVTPTATPTPEPDAAATAVAMLPECGQVPAGWVAYTVRRGDTLSSLSLSSGATIEQIILANCLHQTGLLAGLRIYLPARPPTRVACGPPTHWVRYTVRPGDTMFALARSRGTTVYAILQANCRSSSYLIAGQQIYLPPVRPTATVPPTATLIATATTTPTTLPPATETAMATPTATITVTVSVTPSPTVTATATQGAPGTRTPTATASPTPTTKATTAPTTTATSPPTPTPADSATPVPTNTVEPTAPATPTTAPTRTAAPKETSEP